MCFFNWEKLNQTMPRKESKFYVINLIDFRIILKKKMLTQSAMKTYSEIV